MHCGAINHQWTRIRRKASRRTPPPGIPIHTDRKVVNIVPQQLTRWTHTHTHTHTHNRLMAFVRDNPGRPVPEETLTHSHPTWSPDILHHLPPFTAIQGILFVHFMCLTILSDYLCPGPLWSSSWSWTLNFILHTVFAPVYIDITADTSHSSTQSLCIAQLITSLGTLSKAFSKYTNQNRASYL